MTMTRTSNILLTALLLLLTVACEEEAAPPPPPAQDVATQEATDHDDRPAQIRQAYGIPIPPEVTLVREGPRYVYVETRLKVHEVREFFEERLVDYEFLQENRYKLKIVGLRSGMPQIYVWYRRSSLPTAIRFIEPPPTTEPADDEDAEKATAKVRQPKQKRVKGAEVTERLPDGRLMAPGARWGEPYTPPPGSPLDQPRFRPNFGKPYGTWSTN